MHGIKYSPESLFTELNWKRDLFQRKESFWGQSSINPLLWNDFSNEGICGSFLVLRQVRAQLEMMAKCNLNWSLGGVSHLGQAKLLDSNRIQGKAADKHWRWLLVMEAGRSISVSLFFRERELTFWYSDSLELNYQFVMQLSTRCEY